MKEKIDHYGDACPKCSDGFLGEWEVGGDDWCCCMKCGYVCRRDADWDSSKIHIPVINKDEGLASIIRDYERYESRQRTYRYIAVLAVITFIFVSIFSFGFISGILWK